MIEDASAWALSMPRRCAIFCFKNFIALSACTHKSVLQMLRTCTSSGIPHHLSVDPKIAYKHIHRPPTPLIHQVEIGAHFSPVADASVHTTRKLVYESALGLKLARSGEVRELVVKHGLGDCEPGTSSRRARCSVVPISWTQRKMARQTWAGETLAVWGRALYIHWAARHLRPRGGDCGRPGALDPRRVRVRPYR